MCLYMITCDWHDWAVLQMVTCTWLTLPNDGIACPNCDGFFHLMQSCIFAAFIQVEGIGKGAAKYYPKQYGLRIKLLQVLGSAGIKNFIFFSSTPPFTASLNEILQRTDRGLHAN